MQRTATDRKAEAARYMQLTEQAQAAAVTAQAIAPVAPAAQVFAVQGNWDQISKFFGIRALKWERVYPDKVPNRVQYICADKAEAEWLYNALRSAKCVALRNWLD